MDGNKGRSPAQAVLITSEKGGYYSKAMKQTVSKAGGPQNLRRNIGLRRDLA